MIHLIVGGAAQGKLAYALSCYGLTEQQISEGNLDGPIVNRLQEWVRKLLAQQIDPLARIDELVEGRDLVILCDEVGCGVVPIDPAQREWREAVGRVCCALAQKAVFVDRVQCGIATRIKGGPGCLPLC
ncbi:MAG: bifunctional adenosylcobinamide kinase/adenosylcobinamide-phosphate guanylyltransferase [Massilioclostridium sp.]|nr:bifunctional adenosylcobinamide kinase/adenosylcobinamide-phosphate guanylyltransferase [Massilioclostridium sp.]